MPHNHHDTGYKELFSHPEFVQQLIEGFAPPEIAQMMDFSTLENHSGNYVTPLFQEKFEDRVWSVQVNWNGLRVEVFLYLLLEFQSTVVYPMALRLMHYLVCFYDHLLKSKKANLKRGLPPVLPIVLYNGSKRWNAKEDIYQLIRPEPPQFLRVYQPHLRYYLIDEGRYTEEELAQRRSPLSGVFGIENAAADIDALQRAVDRIVALIQADPNKQRMDEILTRWIKRHLYHLDAQINLDQLNSLTENKDMLAENLETLRENLINQGVQAGMEKGRMEGRMEGTNEAKRETARNLIRLGVLTDAQIAEA
ncbi:MAG: Rpn family recombination-promoting nuclease/putative transposase, partial [Gammaproteobacteria bacterium]|nr:Rpn family recombination-promoting nuclease/putative transposase [Gammaproteobacteria bacterium]